MKPFVQICLFLFPWPIRRRLLCGLFGYHIHPAARIGYSIILAKQLEMAAKARIGNFVFCKPIDRICMGEDTAIGTGNYITGFATSNQHHFIHVTSRRCELVLEQGAGITGRQYLDCNGGIYVGAFTVVAGLRTQILTHSIDVYRNRQHAASVRIGKYCFLGTSCVILPGAELPDYCILAAGSVLNKKYEETGMLYAGNPVRPKKKLAVENIPWMQRTTLSIK